MNSASHCLFAVAIVGLLFVAGCSSADDSTSSTSAAAVSSADETTTTVDNRTDEEAAIDRLDVLMFGLGVTDLEPTANCVIDRLEAESIELTGEGTGELIALFGCDDNAMAQWLPTTNPALSTEAWSCTVGSIGDWISGLTIPATGVFFDADQPPGEFIESTATRCDVSEDDLLAAFSL